jgi:hypothetical protein
MKAAVVGLIKMTGESDANSSPQPSPSKLSCPKGQRLPEVGEAREVREIDSGI